MARPLVSIGIPTYNREASLSRALESALGQTYSNLEVIVSDNASTDGTQGLCGGKAKLDPRMRYHRQPTNQGPISNLAFVLAQAQGKYFMWHADDDYAAPTYVERCVDFLESHPDTACVFTDYVQVDESGRITETNTITHLRPERDWREARRELLGARRDESVMAMYGVYRLGVLRAAGPPRPHTFRRLISGAEGPFLAAIAVRGRVVALPERLFIYSNHQLHKESQAHQASSGLRRWELALLVMTLETSIAATVLASALPLRDKAELLQGTLRQLARRVARAR